MTTLNQYLDPDVSFPLRVAPDLSEAIHLSLTTRARARPDDDVQDPTVLGGWWGDTFPDVEGDQFGSRLWTLQGRGVPTALALIPEMVDEALAWAVEDGLIVEHETAVRVIGPGVIRLTVSARQPSEKVAEIYGPWQIVV